MPPWFLYLVRCKNGSLYTGITTDVNARVKAHNAGQGAKYTRSFGPVVLVYSKQMKTSTSARKREAEIKKMTKSEKERVVLK
ncbi:MAG: GIY-YIG nuclease family protein [Patescibacteria group bacterium]|jgi:putative endonuclease